MSYRELILAEPTLLHYWPFDNDWTAAAGGVNFVRGGSGPAFGAARQGAAAGQFNGTDDTLVTEAPLDLTAYNAVSIELWLRFLTYDLVNNKMLFEFSNNFIDYIDAFLFASMGANAGDPVTVALKGNVGSSQAFYNLALTHMDDGAYHHAVIVLDKSLPANEVNLYQNAALLAPSSRSTNSNNTNNFGNRLLYVASRAGSSFHSNVLIDELAIYSGVLPEANILAHFNYGSGRRRRALCA